MRRHIVIAMAATGLGILAAAPARAQAPTVTFYVGASAADTATGLVPGVTGTLPIRVANPNFYSYYDYLTSARFTVHFDPAKLTVLGAAPSTGGGFTTIDSFTVGTGTARVVASAPGWVGGTTDAEALSLVVQLQTGVTDGAYLWLEPDSAGSYCYYCTPSGNRLVASLALIGQACHATKLWGDVDGNGKVESRDALIALSAAVGLPVTGYDLAQGDVDGDGLTNSRDALMMLSYAVGKMPGSSGPVNRVGVAQADACPGLTAPGETVVFRRNLGGSGGIFRLDSTSTTPVQLTTVLADQWPRLNAAGTAIVFQCPDTTSTPQVCRALRDGTGRSRLTAGTPSTQPDWSPDGTKILSLYGNVATQSAYVRTMDSIGGNPLPTYATGIYASLAAWSRNDSVYAYSQPSHTGLIVAVVGTQPNLTPIDLNYGFVAYATPLRWSPDGTVIAVIDTTNGRGGILTMPATGGMSLPAAAPTAIRAFDWGPQGVIFSLPDTHGTMSLWMLQGGFGGPLVRLTNPGYGSGQADDQPSFRRNP